MTWHSAIQIALSPLRVHVSDHYLIAQCDHATLAAAMREAGLVADALVVDAPYSARVHDGHDNGAEMANAVGHGEPSDNRRRQALGLLPFREALPYARGVAMTLTRSAARGPVSCVGGSDR